MSLILKDLVVISSFVILHFIIIIVIIIIIIIIIIIMIMIMIMIIITYSQVCFVSSLSGLPLVITFSLF